jgi:uncharacterized protein YbaA (DUF1428 family)
MPYVDGYVIPIPVKNLPAYRRMAQKASEIWMDHGALDYHETVGEDLKTKFGTTFIKLLKLKKGETAIFAWITYKSRKHRDTVNAKVMKDPRLGGPQEKEMPFDMKRMTYGGFNSIVDA